MFKRLSQAPFARARLRLTAWYVVTAIVMILAFDLLIIQAEQTSYLRVKRVGLGAEFSSPSLIEFEEQFGQFSQGFKQRLALFSGVMVALSTLVGYFLSGKALQPIQAMFEKQQAFAADVSHELRTPLTSIMLSIDHFKLTQATQSASTLKLLESIQEEAARMKHIAQGLLLLMRHDAQPHLKDAPVPLLEVVERARKHMQPIAQSKRQTIEIEPAASEIKVMGNEEELLQVVLILLDNAIKYSPAKATTTLSLKRMAHAARLTVADQGIGVASQDMQTIFKRFNRGSNTLSPDKKPAGLGLGLAIAHEIIVRHQGTIRVKRLKQGSVFMVSLPCLRSS
jgi:signal transduction histidine kinase